MINPSQPESMTNFSDLETKENQVGHCDLHLVIICELMLTFSMPRVLDYHDYDAVKQFS